ncbi:MAG: hypothetical protein Tsb0032_40050 [Kiloniellaceae bacterium]
MPCSSIRWDLRGATGASAAGAAAEGLETLSDGTGSTLIFNWNAIIPDPPLVCQDVARLSVAEFPRM